MKARHFLVRFQNERCYLCAEKFLTKQIRGWMKNPLFATVDHVRPARDGHSKNSNSLLACRRCNHLKGARQPRACELLYLNFANQAVTDEIKREAQRRRIRRRRAA